MLDMALVVSHKTYECAQKFRKQRHVRVSVCENAVIFKVGELQRCDAMFLMFTAIWIQPLRSQWSNVTKR